VLQEKVQTSNSSSRKSRKMKEGWRWKEGRREGRKEGREGGREGGRWLGMRKKVKF
jgi:hypothetical protein